MPRSAGMHCLPKNLKSNIKLIMQAIARNSSPLSTYLGTSQMDQSAPPKTPNGRQNNHHPTTHRRHAKSAHRPNPPQILAESSALATLSMDLPLHCHKIGANREDQPEPPTTPGNPRRSQAEHIFPLVGRPAELPRCQICPGRVRRCYSVFAAQSPCRDYSGAWGECRDGGGESFGYDGGL